MSRAVQHRPRASRLLRPVGQQAPLQQIEMARAGLGMVADDGHVARRRDFQDGARFGSGFVVSKMRAMASAGRRLAKRPHLAWLSSELSRADGEHDLKGR